MNIERAKRIIESYGADPLRWPQHERAEAIALVERSAELQALLEEAARLDALLDQITPARAPAGLRERILGALETVPRRDSLIDRFLDWLVDGTPRERVLRPVMASLLPLLLGFAVGAFIPVEGTEELRAQYELANEVAELAFIDTETLELAP